MQDPKIVEYVFNEYFDAEESYNRFYAQVTELKSQMEKAISEYNYYKRFLEESKSKRETFYKMCKEIDPYFFG